MSSWHSSVFSIRVTNFSYIFNVQSYKKFPICILYNTAKRKKYLIKYPFLFALDVKQPKAAKCYLAIN